MKIEAKIQHYTLECICSLHDVVMECYSTNPKEIQFTKEFTAILNLIDLLIIKFKKKLLEKSNTTKPFKISLNYYQAFYLKNFIVTNVHFYNGVLERTLLQQFTQKLDQQL